MDRNKRIDRLVDRCVTSGGKGKAGCVPCFARNLCFAAVRRPVEATPKK